MSPQLYILFCGELGNKQLLNKCKYRFDYVKYKTLEESQQLNLLAVIQSQKDPCEARYHDER